MSHFCRRDFLKISGAASLAAVAAPRITLADDQASQRNRDTLVVIFLRGAMDGLNAVVPYTENEYYARRATIAVPRPGSMNGALPLNEQFALHPSLAPLMPFWDKGELGIVHAVGLTTPSRSHFDAQDFMERAWMAQGGIGSGWLNRHLQTSAEETDSTFRALAIGKTVMRSLSGSQPVIGLDTISSFGIQSRSTRAEAEVDALQASFGDQAFIDVAAQQAFGAIDALNASGAGTLAVENGATYTNNGLGTQLADVARLIKAGVGVEVAALDYGGWDTHDAENQRLPVLLDTLARNMAAFATDLGSKMANVTVITMTEFGRRVYQNASGGTDHGRGSAMFLLGPGVYGKQIYADWPSLRESELDNGDLKVTMDYRSVLAEVLSRRMGNSNFDTIFPEWEGQPTAGIFAQR